MTSRRFGKAALDQLYRGVRQPGRPLLFLDFDDVICTNDPYGGYDVFLPDHPVDLWERLWNPKAVATLRVILDKYDPQVVLTTSWLRLLDREGFENIFQRTGLEKLTRALHPDWEAPQEKDRTRFQAIEKWLNARYEGQPLVVLDDPYSGTGLKGSRLDKAGCVILCELKVGLHDGLLPRIDRALGLAAA
jgi:hypothetical protein